MRALARVLPFDPSIWGMHVRTGANTKPLRRRERGLSRHHDLDLRERTRRADRWRRLRWPSFLGFDPGPPNLRSQGPNVPPPSRACIDCRRSAQVGMLGSRTFPYSRPLHGRQAASSRDITGDSRMERTGPDLRLSRIPSPRWGELGTGHCGWGPKRCQAL